MPIAHVYGGQPEKWEGVCELIWMWLKPDTPMRPESRALLALAYTLARREAEDAGR